jgi:2-dehydropantoate 2-reductase
MIEAADRSQKLSLIQKLSAVALTHPAFIRLLFHLLPKLFPFDIETYLKVHFTKVGAQQQNVIHEFVNQAKAYHLPSDQIQRLLK